VTVVAVHQPNYLPWLGYFAKIARADIFVFLDDVQFSKGSFTNRVQIARGGAPSWLTQPVRYQFGDPISVVSFAKPDWARAHAEAIRQTYRRTACFPSVWPDIEALLAEATGGLATVNVRLNQALAARLGLVNCRFVKSSSLPISRDAEAGTRLAEIVAHLAPGGTYLSGKGGAKYQSEVTFAARGIRLVYSTFSPPTYSQGHEPFLPGLSIIDALFHCGWEATAEQLRAAA
jgi:hypothetical protein